MHVSHFAKNKINTYIVSITDMIHALKAEGRRFEYAAIQDKLPNDNYL